MYSVFGFHIIHRLINIYVVENEGKQLHIYFSKIIQTIGECRLFCTIMTGLPSKMQCRPKSNTRVPVVMSLLMFTTCNTFLFTYNLR